MVNGSSPVVVGPVGRVPLVAAAAGAGRSLVEPVVEHRHIETSEQARAHPARRDGSRTSLGASGVDSGTGRHFFGRITA